MLVTSLLREETLEEEKFWGRKRMGFSDSSVCKESTCNAGDRGEESSVLGSGRSPGGGHGKPLQCSCLENPMDRGAWWATVHFLKELDMAEVTEHACRQAGTAKVHFMLS